MNKISGVIITKNASRTISQALQSLQFCDEIIVIDNQSIDDTKEITRKYNAKVYDFRSLSFADSRNEGLKKAKGEWILYIDADERVSLELQNEIKHLIIDSDRLHLLNAYFVKRKNFYFGNYQWPYIEKLERLFKKESLIEWYGKLHETPRYLGKIGELNGYLYHYTHRNLSEMVTKTNEWSEIEASLRFNAQHPHMTWWRFPRVMISAFYDSYIRQGGYKVGSAGIIESIYQAFSIFITYAKLWELQEIKK